MIDEAPTGGVGPELTWMVLEAVGMMDGKRAFTAVRGEGRNNFVAPAANRRPISGDGRAPRGRGLMSVPTAVSAVPKKGLRSRVVACVSPSTTYSTTAVATERVSSGIIERKRKL